MDLGINGKVALVLGGSRGLGFASAQALAREGAKVMIAARDPERIREAVAEIKAEGGTAEGVSADMLTEEGIDASLAAARDTFGDIDILVYVPSVSIHGLLDDVGESEYEWGHNSMVRFYARLVRAVVPHMKAQRWGRILTIGSNALKNVHRQLPRTLYMTYRMAHAGFSKSLSDELGPWNITVNTLAPGPFTTDLFMRLYERRAREMGMTMEEAEAEQVAPVPVKRFGRPEELGAAVAFHCSDLAGFITGQQIFIDGGMAPTIL